MPSLYPAEATPNLSLDLKTGDFDTLTSFPSSPSTCTGSSTSSTSITPDPPSSKDSSFSGRNYFREEILSHLPIHAMKKITFSNTEVDPSSRLHASLPVDLLSSSHPTQSSVKKTSAIVQKTLSPPTRKPFEESPHAQKIKDFSEFAFVNHLFLL